MSASVTQDKSQHLATPVETAKITWNQDATPTSTQFNDVYFSNENGLKETEYVFLKHNQLSQRWRNLNDEPKTVFTIAETGFGTGLNFLAVCAAWKQHSLSHARLHFISVEKYPLNLNDLKTALAQWPDLQPYANNLIDRYPPLVAGFHPIDFPELRIRLTLILDDAVAALAKLNAKVDAWFLDGFAPSKNPEMWQPDLFQQIQRLSEQGTTLATFTAAGRVRRGLQEAGFDIQKHKGFGHKREMISGIKKTNNVKPTTLPHTHNPWFQKRTPDPKVTSVIVVGSGLAGSNTARSLANRGFKVTVVDRHNAIAQEASGNPVGITFTKLSPFDNAQNRFYQKAYLYSVACIAQRFHKSDLQEGTDYQLNGVLRFAFNEKEQEEQKNLVASGLWPQSIAEQMSKETCSELIGFACKYGGLLLKQGGWLTPADLCQINLEHQNITVKLGESVLAVKYLANQWQLTLSNTTLSADALVLANGFGANQFAGLDFLPLRSVKGQITYVPATHKSQKLKHALNYDGYITPAKNGFHCVGATFRPKDTSLDFFPEDHLKNIRNLENTLPEMAAVLFGSTPKKWPLEKGRVAFRCQSPDYLPMIGPVPNIKAFKSDYKNLRKGFLKKDFPLGNYLPNLYVNVAHGSRGITSAPFAAEIIAAYINQEPQPIDNEVLEALHPARFAIRGLKRNQV